jgi:hypothetical protein
MATTKATPDDAELLEALQQLHLKYPLLGRAKVLDALRVNNDWALSEKRLKKCMDAHNLNVKEIKEFYVAAVQTLKDMQALRRKIEKEQLPVLPASPLINQ